MQSVVSFRQLKLTSLSGHTTLCVLAGIAACSSPVSNFCDASASSIQLVPPLTYVELVCCRQRHGAFSWWQACLGQGGVAPYLCGGHQHATHEGVVSSRSAAHQLLVGCSWPPALRTYSGFFRRSATANAGLIMTVSCWINPCQWPQSCPSSDGLRLTSVARWRLFTKCFCYMATTAAQQHDHHCV